MNQAKTATQALRRYRARVNSGITKIKVKPDYCPVGPAQEALREYRYQKDLDRGLKMKDKVKKSKKKAVKVEITPDAKTTVQLRLSLREFERYKRIAEKANVTIDDVVAVVLAAFIESNSDVV